LLEQGIAALVGVPLVEEGRWVATLSVHSANPRPWTPEQVALIEMTADRTWSASERARAEKALDRSEDRQAFLRRLNQTIQPLADPARILATTCRLLGERLRVNRVAYGQISGDDCVIEDDYVEGVPSLAGTFRWTDLAGARTGEIMTGGCLITNDAATDPRTAHNRDALKAAGIGAYLCPLLIKDGQWVAAFGIHNREPRVWTPDEIALAQDVADRIWAALEHRKAEAALRANEERLAFLLGLNDALRRLSDPGDVQDTASRLLCEQLGASRVGYADIDGQRYVIRREYARGGVPPVGVPPMISVGPVLGAAFQRGETVTVNDVDADPRIPDDDKQAIRSRQIAGFVAATLVKAGRVVAVFRANNTTPRVWTAAEIELVRAVAERTWDAVERTRAEAELRERKTRLQLALEASSGGSWTWDAVSQRVDWDDRFRELYGFGPEVTASSDAWIPLVHDDDRATVLALLDAVMTSGRDSWDHTFRIVRPDGSIVWIQSHGRADRDERGTITRLTGLDLDFTTHRRGEEALQARREEEHDRALRLLLETATQGIVSTDAKGTIPWTSDSALSRACWTARRWRRCASSSGSPGRPATRSSIAIRRVAPRPSRTVVGDPIAKRIAWRRPSKRRSSD
jgi:PAS domain S-box-containing protein